MRSEPRHDNTGLVAFEWHFDAFAQATACSSWQGRRAAAELLYVVCCMSSAACSIYAHVGCCSSRPRQTSGRSSSVRRELPPRASSACEYSRLHRQHTEHLVNSTASSSLGDPTPKHWRAAPRNALHCTVLIAWQHGAVPKSRPTGATATIRLHRLSNESLRVPLALMKGSPTSDSFGRVCHQFAARCGLLFTD